ncbi:TetR/AcrR family transcriptional regulator (plasmid) [Martelella lutilitoris]|uniref:TetR/AcrR family transcriptional regulator n=1 Tax=Martelella lutilitoris TaxID=2583532 RepID=A0A7T7HPC5_9HYPH|nr:TetR/AcrR family transcriptional regulator [Martelella lutilitoris]QQM32906.1 TetR/AcrR family transcriptional regulator [Martelella lutilitoris]QRX65146.1 TetR/AcrR family transcriptional regulator [Dysgonomonadaceae bacterium zrk40]
MTMPDATPKISAHDRLIQAAMILFYNHGIGGTGIDAIVERAGVAKKSLYNNFASKADLVNQYIEARHAEWLALYAAREATASHPKERILAVFDAYQDHAEHAYERGFRGCGLLNAAAELEAGDAGREAVRRHKEQVENIVAQHLSEIVPDDFHRVSSLAAHIAFLLEGAMTRAGLEGNSARVISARAMVSDMLKAL